MHRIIFWITQGKTNILVINQATKMTDYTGL